MLFAPMGDIFFMLYSHAQANLTHESVILVCVLNVGLYVFFTFISILRARPPAHPESKSIAKDMLSVL